MIRSIDPVPARGGYPERADVPQPAFDRLTSQVKWRFHCLFRRRLSDPGRLAAAVHAHMSRADAASLDQQIPGLRYRLRRDGFSDGLLAECFGLYGAACLRCDDEPPGPDALGAAQLLLAGGIVDVAAPAVRIQALALAAAALAIHGTPVHLLAMSSARAQHIAKLLQPGFAVLGLSFTSVTGAMPASARIAAYRSAIVCSTHREIAGAYLQDRVRMAGRSRLLMRALAGETARSEQGRRSLLPGLCFALVDEADLVMLDDAYAPVTISTESDQAQVRLLYEQTLELARACEPDDDFVFDESGLRLTDPGSERLTRLVAPLGGVWSARQRREELVVSGLFALHALERDVHYRVIQGRVIFRPPDPVSGDEPEGPDPVLVKLVELKEGCRLSGARDVIARISVPRFFRRYLGIAGVCADAHGLEQDFWALYNMRTTRVGSQLQQIDCRQRLFRSVAAKHAAVLAAVSEHAQRGSVVVAARTPDEAQALTGALGGAGFNAGLLRGVMDDGERAVLAGLNTIGSVAVALFPSEGMVTPPDGSRVPLHLIVAELHDAGRHVTRMASAFNADSCEMLLSLDEEGIAARAGPIAAAIAGFHDGAADELPAQQARWIARLAQRDAEQSRSLMRRDLIMRDEYMSDLLAFSGRRE